MKTIFFLLLMCSVAYAQPMLMKPNISSSKILSKAEQVQVRAYLKRKVHKDLTPVKNDHVDNSSRGTVKYSRNVRNYAYHKVVIADGSVIQDTNFSQPIPFKRVIVNKQGGLPKNLTFIRCNVRNVEADPSWTFIHSPHSHNKRRIITDNGKQYEVVDRYINGDWKEISRSEIYEDIN